MGINSHKSGCIHVKKVRLACHVDYQIYGTSANQNDKDVQQYFNPDLEHPCLTLHVQNLNLSALRSPHYRNPLSWTLSLIPLKIFSVLFLLPTLVLLLISSSQSFIAPIRLTSLTPRLPLSLFLFILNANNPTPFDIYLTVDLPTILTVSHPFFYCTWLHCYCRCCCYCWLP